jgi:hypothetical protein
MGQWTDSLLGICCEGRVLLSHDKEGDGTILDAEFHHNPIFQGSMGVLVFHAML